MRFTPLLAFSWPPQPEARVLSGPAYTADGRQRKSIDLVCVPYPFRRVPPEAPLDRKHPRLVEALATLEVSVPERIEEFAASWGLLVRETPWVHQKAPQGETWLGQSLETWRIWVAELREALDLWHAISQSDRPAIGKLVSVERRNGRQRAVYRGQRAGFTIPLARQNLTTAAEVVLAKLVTDRIETARGIEYDRSRARHLRQVERPRSLLAAAWAQYAEHVTRDTTKECPRCGSIFIIEVDAAGRKPEHCSDACRLAMHRRRVKAREGRA